MTNDTQPAVPAVTPLQRLDIQPDEMDRGHYAALSHPHELADRLTAYAVGTR